MNFDLQFVKMNKSDKINLYVRNMYSIFNEHALFSDGTEFYRSPSEPMPYSEVRIRFRTAKANVEAVHLVVLTDGDAEKLPMKHAFNDRLFDYYEVMLPLTDKRIRYYFTINSGHYTCYYNSIGVTQNPDEQYHFTISPGFTTPDWAKGAVFYQIFVDRFYNGDSTNDVVNKEYAYIGEPCNQVEDWFKYPSSMDVRSFYGGDLEGVMKKLDYLQSLGVDAIYLNPVFVSPSNHKYDIQDYDYIDPHYGKIVVDGGEVLQDGELDNKKATKYISRVTNKANLEASNKFFIEFVEEVHKRGMKVILDGVFNHCGSFNKWLDRERIYEEEAGYERGAFIDESSPYHTFFRFFEERWPYNTSYDGWWGMDTLPKLNYEDSPKLVEYIMRIARKWVSPPYNVDGWRLDVAADLGHSPEYNHDFWKEFRRNVKEANPNAIILAEHYGDPVDWLQGDQWDTVMNYDAFMEPVSWFLTGVEKHSDEFREDMLGNADNFFGAMRHFMTRFNTQSLHVAMNELSNHDHSRFLTRTNHRVGRTASVGPEAAEEGINKAIMRLAVMIQMTWPGAPTIYYGDEAGVCGWTDPDSRRTYPWGREDQEMIDYHKAIIRIHKDYEVLKTGSLMFLHNEYGFISYARFNEQEKIVVLINSSDHVITADIDVWKTGLFNGEMMGRLFMTKEDGFTDQAELYHADGGKLHVTCPARSGMIIKNLS